MLILALRDAFFQGGNDVIKNRDIQTIDSALTALDWLMGIIIRYINTVRNFCKASNWHVIFWCILTFNQFWTPWNCSCVFLPEYFVYNCLWTCWRP